MNTNRRLRLGLRGRLWGICAAAVAVVSLLDPSSSSAQTDTRDPVERFRDALESDLDNLPFEDDADRAATRKSILDYRQKVLTEAAGRIVTLRDLSRSLRLGTSTLRENRYKDLRLLEIDRGVFTDLIQKFVAAFKKQAQSTDPLIQRATAVLASDLVSKVYSDQRGLVGGAVVRDLLPELARLAESPDSGVRIAVARAMGTIILELKEALTPRASELIRSTILRIQKSGDPEPRRAVIDTTASLVKLLNPDAGEESIQPKIATREDLFSLLNLTPILFNGMADEDALTRKKATFVLSRLTNLVARDRVILIVTPSLSQPPAGRKMTEEEVAFIKTNQADLDRELKAIQPRIEVFRTQTDVLAKVVVDPDPEIRLSALRMLEDLGTLQNYVSERIVSLPSEKKDETTPAPATSLGPVFVAVRPSLVRNLSDPNPKVRLAAAQVLESRGESARPAARALIERLSDPNPFVRWVAVRTLGRFRSPAAPGAVEGLGNTLMDRDLSVRIAAANALESLGAEAGPAIPALLASANRGDADYREAALRAIGTAGPFVPSTVILREKRGQVIVPVVARELSNPDVRVRRAAALALGRLGNDAALAAGALQKALNDDDSEVRRYATEALLAK